jgi:tRNA(Ile2) C34 agmatinyltransferase TiaS
MKIVITENQYNKLFEIVTDTEVICDECGWSWELSDGGDDPYICHKCGHNNEEKK